MNLDTWILIAIAVFALLGVLRGAARQMASIVALVCATFASRPLSEAIGPWWAQRQPGLSLSVALLLSFAISFVLVALLAYVMVFLSIRPQARKQFEAEAETKTTPPPSHLSPLGNRGLGLCLGALKGSLLLWLLLSLMTLVTQKMNWLPFRLPWELSDSYAYAFVKKHNAFNQAQWAKYLALEKMAALPSFATQLLPTGKPGQPPSPVTQELDKLRELFDKSEIGKAFEKKQFHTLLKDEKLDKLLKDDAVLNALEDFRRFSKQTTTPPTHN